MNPLMMPEVMLMNGRSQQILLNFLSSHVVGILHTIFQQSTHFYVRPLPEPGGYSS